MRYRKRGPDWVDSMVFQTVSATKLLAFIPSSLIYTTTCQKQLNYLNVWGFPLILICLECPVSEISSCILRKRIEISSLWARPQRVQSSITPWLWVYFPCSFRKPSLLSPVTNGLYELTGSNFSLHAFSLSLSLSQKRINFIRRRGIQVSKKVVCN